MDFPFSPKSIGALVEAIATGYTQARIGTLLLKAGAEDWAPDRWDNKEHRIQLVFKSLRATEDPDAAASALELARLTLEAGAPASAGGTSHIVWWEPLKDALAEDGWEYDIESARLTPVVPSAAVPEHPSGPEKKLEEQGWITSPPGAASPRSHPMENRHIDPLRRIGQADEAWAADGNEPIVFHLSHSGDGPEIDHPRWDRSWSTPSEQTIDDLEELGYLRVAPHHNKARSFDLTMAGRAESVLQRRRMGAEAGGQPPIAVEPTIGLVEPEGAVVAPPSPISANNLQDAEIFVVHGHSRKSDVALFLASVTKTQPVILDERAGKGRTIIEKFEQESGGSGFAVVLLTADDVGRSAADEELELSARARQNVIFELGYFIGKLGRDRVLALYDDGVEQPSDYSGIEYISFAGDWKADLIRELAAAGFSIYPAGS